MVTLDKQERSVYSRVLHNLRLTCKRDFCRKRFIIRWTVIAVVLVLIVRTVGKSNFSVDIQLGDPHHHHDHILEIKQAEGNGKHVVIVDPLEKQNQQQMLENLNGGLQPPKQDNFVQVELREAPKEEEELVHAFTGPTNQEPIYLDFIDRNLPWDKQAEVSQDGESGLLVLI